LDDLGTVETCYIPATRVWFVLGLFDVCHRLMPTCPRLPNYLSKTDVSLTEIYMPKTLLSIKGPSKKWMHVKQMKPYCNATAI